MSQGTEDGHALAGANSEGNLAASENSVLKSFFDGLLAGGDDGFDDLHIWGSLSSLRTCNKLTEFVCLLALMANRTASSDLLENIDFAVS